MFQILRFISIVPGYYPLRLVYTKHDNGKINGRQYKKDSMKCIYLLA
jgi:hypothetical protein